MSILIQFVKDNMALFVFTIIAVVVLLCSIAGIITFHVMQKRLVKQDRASANEPLEQEQPASATDAKPTVAAQEQESENKPKTDKIRGKKKAGDKHD